MIFKAVGDGRPYPEHGYSTPKQWAAVAPRQVRLDELVTTKRTLDLDALLSEDSTFFGDLFAHVIQWKDTLYLEDGLHRAVRAALAQRPVLHARVLVVADDAQPVLPVAAAPVAAAPVVDLAAAEQAAAEQASGGPASADEVPEPPGPR